MTHEGDKPLVETRDRDRSRMAETTRGPGSRGPGPQGIAHPLVWAGLKPNSLRPLDDVEARTIESFHTGDWSWVAETKPKGAA